jgi:hypothetical protein
MDGIRVGLNMKQRHGASTILTARNRKWQLRVDAMTRHVPDAPHQNETNECKHAYDTMTAHLKAQPVEAEWKMMARGLSAAPFVPATSMELLR